MPTVYDVQADIFIKRLAMYLKEKFPELTPPPWAQFVKTSSHKERPPQNPDWWYIRSASLLRKIYMKGPIGVSRLRLEYGGRKRRDSSPEHFRKGGGSIIRKIIQQLETAKLVETVGKRGRIITPEGKGLLDSFATRLKRELEKGKPKLKKY